MASPGLRAKTSGPRLSAAGAVDLGGRRGSPRLQFRDSRLELSAPAPAAARPHALPRQEDRRRPERDQIAGVDPSAASNANMRRRRPRSAPPRTAKGGRAERPFPAARPRPPSSPAASCPHDAGRTRRRPAFVHNRGAAAPPPPGSSPSPAHPRHPNPRRPHAPCGHRPGTPPTASRAPRAPQRSRYAARAPTARLHHPPSRLPSVFDPLSQPDRSHGRAPYPPYAPRIHRPSGAHLAPPAGIHPRLPGDKRRGWTG